MSINNLPFCSASDRNKAMCRTLPMTTLWRVISQCRASECLCKQSQPTALSTHIYYTHSVQTLLLTKKLRLSGPPWKIFQDLFGARECLNIKNKRQAFSIFQLQRPRSKPFCQDQDQDQDSGSQDHGSQDHDQDSGSQDQDQDFTVCPRGGSGPRLWSQGLHRW